MIIRPFKAVRPDPLYAKEAAALPYDVYSEKEAREEVREEVREKTREEERRKNILNMLKLRCTITYIGEALQLPNDYIIKVARENNIPVSD